LRQAAPVKSPPGLIRYAGGFVVFHADRDVLPHLQRVVVERLAEMGLELHPKKALIPHNGQVGFNFLGFHIRQYPVGKYHHPHLSRQPGLQDYHQA
jgi:RNA-directed DNA polymerase